MNDLFEMRERAKAAVRAAAVGLSEDAINALVEHLLREGALFPPVRMGQTLYAAVGANKDVQDDSIDEWQVHGVTYYEGEFYILDRNGDESRLGEWDCLLTREEAEDMIKELGK